MKRDRKPPNLISVVPDWALESQATLQHSRVASRPAGSRAKFGSSSPTFFRVNEAAAVLQVSSKTIRRLIARGDLKAIRIGRSVRIHSSEIESLIARGGSCEGDFGGGESDD